MNNPHDDRGTTYVSSQTARAVQHERVATNGPATAPTTGPKPEAASPPDADADSTAELPEALRGAGSHRRRTLRALLGALALAAILATVTIVLAGGQPAVDPAQITYTGDWKDTLIEEAGEQTYSGDWKDTLIEESGQQTYTGDWKDTVIEEGGARSYSGDWKDTLIDQSG